MFNISYPATSFKGQVKVEPYDSAQQPHCFETDFARDKKVVDAVLNLLESNDVLLLDNGEKKTLNVDGEIVVVDPAKNEIIVKRDYAEREVKVSWAVKADYAQKEMIEYVAGAVRKLSDKARELASAVSGSV